MDLFLENNDYHYELEKLCRLFYPMQRIRVFEKGAAPADPDPMCITARFRDGTASVTFQTPQGTSVSESPCSDPADAERTLAVLLWRFLQKESGFTPQWGILTGIRPVKLLRRLAERFGEAEAAGRLLEDYLVSPQKVALARETLHNESAVLSKEKENGCSVYVGIPFCPTRCAYCSFVSTTVEKTMRLIPAYLDCLCREIAAAGAVAKDLGLSVQSVYIGGGTPTTLSASQLSRLLAASRCAFDLSACLEYTVEAGRPDTVTREKLQVLHENGVTRVSINPQTMHDDVLEAIGRRHTTAQTLAAFALAREAGFQNINMDLIAGLPRDTYEGFCDSVRQVLALSPESVTVHTLALKRASRIYQEHEEKAARLSGAVATDMLRFADQTLLAEGFLPYYLYRQSRILGGLENVGFAKPGNENFYNTVIMDESQTILACGAGAGTKVVAPDGSGRLKRVFNFKYPYEYIHRHEEVLARKEQVRELYAAFCR